MLREGGNGDEHLTIPGAASPPNFGGDLHLGPLDYHPSFSSDGVANSMQHEGGGTGMETDAWGTFFNEPGHFETDNT